MRKMDEMELRIRDQAVLWCWFFTVIALATWSVYDMVAQRAASPAHILLAAQFLLYFFLTAVGKWQVGDGDSAKRFALRCVGVVVSLLAFGAALFLLGGRA